MRCQQYFGTGTASNRLKWRVIVVLASFGLIMMIGTFFTLYKQLHIVYECFEDPDMVDKYGPYSQHTYKDRAFWEKMQLACMRKHPSLAGYTSAIGIFQWLWILAWIGASIPLYMMCCCTPKPECEVCGHVDSGESVPPVAAKAACKQGRKDGGQFDSLLSSS